MPLTLQHRHRLYGSGLKLVHYDEFTDVDATALASHVPNLGGAYSAIIGTYTIASNKASVATTGSPGTQSLSVADIGKTNFDAQVRFQGTSGGGGIAFRRSGNVFYFCQGAYNNFFQIYYFDGASYSALATATPTISSTTAYIIKLRLRGSSAVAELYHTVTGALLATISTNSVTNNPSSTQVGLRSDTANFTFDDLSFRA